MKVAYRIRICLERELNEFQASTKVTEMKKQWSGMTKGVWIEWTNCVVWIEREAFFECNHGGNFVKKKNGSDVSRVDIDEAEKPFLGRFLSMKEEFDLYLQIIWGLQSHLGCPGIAFGKGKIQMSKHEEHNWRNQFASQTFS